MRSYGKQRPDMADAAAIDDAFLHDHEVKKPVPGVVDGRGRRRREREPRCRAGRRRGRRPASVLAAAKDGTPAAHPAPRVPTIRDSRFPGRRGSLPDQAGQPKAACAPFPGDRSARLCQTARGTTVRTREHSKNRGPARQGRIPRISRAGSLAHADAGR